MGQALPPRKYLSFVRRVQRRFLFSFVRRIMGIRSPGIPHYDCASWSGVGKGYLEKPVAAL